MVFFLPFWAVYSRGVRGGGRLFAQLTTCREDLSNKPFSRECWGSSYCPLGNTGSWSPYFAFAQYGLLVALFRFRSIRALAPAMCSGCGPCAHTPPLAAAMCSGCGPCAHTPPLAAAMCSGCGPCAHTPAATRLLPVGEYAEPMPIGNAQAGGYRIEIVELSTFYLISRLNRL